MKFKKKPVIVDAIQWDGSAPALTEIKKLAGDKPDTVRHIQSSNNLFIVTLEGTMTATLNDWIVRGVKGELYPVKPDIFLDTYEAA